MVKILLKRVLPSVIVLAVAAAEDDADLAAERVDFLHALGHERELRRVDALARLAVREHLSRELQEDAPVLEPFLHGHYFTLFRGAAQPGSCRICICVHLHPFGAGGGTRTRTPKTWQGILSPWCLPFHHSGCVRIVYHKFRRSRSLHRAAAGAAALRGNLGRALQGGASPPGEPHPYGTPITLKNLKAPLHASVTTCQSLKS